MPITIENYRNFYFGTSAEFQIMSEVFLLGHEASKLTPDAGFDLIVTNKARQRFENSKPSCFYLQIKFAFEIDKNIRFYINRNEFDLLCADDSAVAVFCYAQPEIAYDPRSFDQRHIQSDMHWEQQNQKDFDRLVYDSKWSPPYGNDLLKKHIKNGSVEIRRTATRYFWLNNKQLQRAKCEQAFTLIKNKDLLMLSLQSNQDGSAAIVFRGYKERLCPELFDIRYAISGCHGSKVFHDGNYLVAHEVVV